jgi:hypothetical protein
VRGLAFWLPAVLFNVGAFVAFWHGDYDAAVALQMFGMLNTFLAIDARGRK